VLKEKEKTIKVRKLIKYLLNDNNEYSTTLYLMHVHGQAVADLFAGDDLYGVDMSLPIRERVKKRRIRSLRIALTRPLRLLLVGSRREEGRCRDVGVGAADNNNNNNIVSRSIIRSN
jgi:hypothetical protein